MKHLLSFISLLFFVIISNAEKLPLKGQIITVNDTVDVIFIVPFNDITGEPLFVRIQPGITYFNKANKKVRLKSYQAKEIRFQFGSKVYRMLSVYNSLTLGNLVSMDTTIFLKLNMDGNLKLFTYYYYGQNGMTGHYPIVKKGNSSIMAPDRISFRSDMKKYLYDCPTLVEKLDDKEFKVRDLEQIILFYNSKCDNVISVPYTKPEEKSYFK